MAVKVNLVTSDECKPVPMLADLCAKYLNHLTSVQSEGANLIRILRAKCYWLQGYGAAHQSDQVTRQVDDIRRLLNEFEQHLVQEIREEHE